jgi:hypothetical protein
MNDKVDVVEVEEVPESYCAVDNRPCNGKCAEQTRQYGVATTWNKKLKREEMKDLMCPALMDMKWAESKKPRKNQRGNNKR